MNEIFNHVLTLLALVAMSVTTGVITMYILWWLIYGRHGNGDH